MRDIETESFHTSNWVNTGKTPVENMMRHWVLNLLGIKKAVFGHFEL